mmetsp:Transcript_17989/g.51061  ORF Transcript_17989/g.51061 Transcript_17989/m.51061 type:complete len:502 (-) Transcript_17989:219-1724(-)
MKVVDEVVLPHQRRRQAQATMRLDCCGHGSECSRRHDLHLVHDHETPLELLDLRHEELGLTAAAAGKAEHAVRRYQHTSLSFAVVNGLLVLSRQHVNVLGRDGREHDELSPPLVYCHRRRGQDEATPSDSAACRNADECLPGSAGQHDDAAFGDAVDGEHLRQGLLLVGPYGDFWLNVPAQHRVLVRSVLPVVILLQQRHAHLVRRGLHLLNAHRVDLDGDHRGSGGRPNLGVVVLGMLLLGPHILLHDALRDIRVGAQPLHEDVVGGFKEMPIVSQDQLRFAYGAALLPNRLDEDVVQDILGQARQDVDDLLNINARGNSGIQRQHRELVLMHKLWPTDRFCDGHQEVGDLDSPWVEALENDAPAGIHPQRSPCMVIDEAEIPEVLSVHEDIEAGEVLGAARAAATSREEGRALLQSRPGNACSASGFRRRIVVEVLEACITVLAAVQLHRRGLDPRLELDAPWRSGCGGCRGPSHRLCGRRHGAHAARVHLGLNHGWRP